MKILKSIGLYFVYPFTTFILGIFTHIGYLNYFYPNKYVPQKNSYFLEDNSYEVSYIPKEITTCDTRYIITEYNAKENTTTEIEQEIPEKYLGMTRNNLEDSLDDYQQNPTLEDMEKWYETFAIKYGISEPHLSFADTTVIFLRTVVSDVANFRL